MKLSITDVCVVGLLGVFFTGIAYSASDGRRQEAREQVSLKRLAVLGKAISLYSADVGADEVIKGLGHTAAVSTPQVLKDYVEPLQGETFEETLHCASAPDWLRRQLTSTFIWPIMNTPGLEPGDDGYRDLHQFEQHLEQMKGETPLIISLVPDTLYYARRDREPAKQKRYELQLRLDGSVWRGWVRKERTDFYSRYRRL